MALSDTIDFIFLIKLIDRSAVPSLHAFHIFPLICMNIKTEHSVRGIEQKQNI